MKRETPKQKAMRLIEKHHAILSEGYTEITVEAPPGYVWSGSGLHELVASAGTEESRARLKLLVNVPVRRLTKEDLWADLSERMEGGIEPCADPECEWCQSEEDPDDLD